MLKRKIYSTLLDWKAHHTTECLLVKGARQIGKTFIIDQFARENYASYLAINFISNPEYRDLFKDNIDAPEIFRRLSLTFRDFKLIPGKTILFLDEIQNCPRARTAFKSLALDGRVDVIASGSLLGLTYLDESAALKTERRESSIPVGYERQIMMYSLDFEEYLWAIGYQPDALSLLRAAYNKLEPLPAISNEQFLKLFREYIVIGGMPAVINRYLATNSFSEVFEEQEKIIRSNLDDIARYAPTIEKPKVRLCYLSIPGQLARENKKFKYSIVEPRGTFRKFGSSIDWLCESALCLKCNNVEQPQLPLTIYQRSDCFKLYASDIGILTGMMGFEVKNAILNNSLKGFAKGGIYENAIMALLVRRGYTPFYHMPKSNQSEIDFLIEKDGGIIPIEVKAGNTPSISFDRILENQDIAVGYKFINGNIGKSGKKITLPHYMAMFV